jgi:hypothetical protein
MVHGGDARRLTWTALVTVTGVTPWKRFKRPSVSGNSRITAHPYRRTHTPRRRSPAIAPFRKEDARSLFFFDLVEAESKLLGLPHPVVRSQYLVAQLKSITSLETAGR